ncbi:pseudaminic acid synthase [Paenibacillus sp. JJ-223]|uniref:pseudaminic acid synthase n=1 Tax=Paenibacillus sp. JJ-223 TaxID=2905647 RepID=UPI001F2BC819|nr:pseudaminic acid synthase [Paenibacillus sp. JJ-223]CAH1223782.1 Pseudaminic acid synthase [Paenibacillus sp. JJ-223]
MKPISISNRLISTEVPPFIIAEMSGNHNKSLDRAIRIVEEAAKAGVDAIKLQTYTPDTMTLDLDRGDFFINEENSLWKGQSLYQLYNEAYTPWEWHEAIFKRCAELGLIVFSSPFDHSAVDFLEKLNAPAYKIASFENTDLPLIRKVAALGKPLIISTGMASVADLDETVKTVKEQQNEQLILLKCTSTYPASPEHTNLATIPHMRDLFGCEVGLSDHTQGIGAAVASIVFGATVIEKHFTLSRADGGVDSAFSLEPEEMKQLVQESKRAWKALGGIRYGASETEKDSMKFRRSIYTSEEVKAGEQLSSSNVRIIRPGYGLAPKYYDFLIGKRVNRDIPKGTPLNWDFIS